MQNLQSPAWPDVDEPPWPAPPAQPREVIDSIFERIQWRFGSAWVSRWAGTNIIGVKFDWAKNLARVEFYAIAYAIENLPTDAPPLLGQFKDICGRAPAQKPLPIAAPKPDPARLAQELGRLNELRADMERPANRLQWAYDLQERDKAGERLTAAQRATYRQVLQRSALPAEVGLLYTQIPLDALPPAMRGDRCNAVNRQWEST